jgi:hypothetical protein
MVLRKMQIRLLLKLSWAEDFNLNNWFNTPRTINKEHVVRQEITILLVLFAIFRILV